LIHSSAGSSAKEMRANRERGHALGLTDAEVAVYDADAHRVRRLQDGRPAYPLAARPSEF